MNPIFNTRASKENAAIISRAAVHFSFNDAVSPQLTSLETSEWKPGKLFNILTSSALLERPGTMYELQNKINTKVRGLLNAYNFNEIKSQDLTDKEVKAIGTLLREAIFAQLSSKEMFSKKLTDSNLDMKTASNNVLNGMLFSELNEIIEGDLIKNQLDIMAEKITAQRNATSLVKASSLMAFSVGGAISQGTIAIGQPVEEMDRTLEMQSIANS